MMHILCSLAVFFAPAFAVDKPKGKIAGPAALDVVDKAKCKAGKVTFSILQKAPIKEGDDERGVPLVTIRKKKEIDLVKSPKSETLFVGPAEESICDHTTAYNLSGGRVAILLGRDERPLPDSSLVAVYDPKSEKLLGDPLPLGTVSKVIRIRDGFAFTTIVPRTDVDTITIKSPLTGRDLSAADYDLEPFTTARLAKNKLSFEDDPKLSFERSEWRKFFKTQDEYLNATGWDPKTKTFKRKIVYKASYFSRKDGPAEETCVNFTDRRGTDFESRPWLCLKEKN